MASPLLETKLHVPRRRRGLVARPRLSERLDRRAESALTLVSAPAGFGKTTLLTEWLAAAPADGRSAAWLSLDQRDNDPALFWTYLIAALQTGGARGRRGRALAAAVAPAADRGGPRHAAQRPQRRQRRCRAGARRLPPDRRARRPGRDGLPAGAPAATDPPGDRRPRRPGAAAGAAAGAWRARRDPRRRSALHPRRGRGVPQRGDGAGADGAGRRGAGGADRRLDRRAAAGGALDAGARRRRRLHRRLRRGRPVHRRLPGRGGPAAPARTGPGLPAADLHPGPAERPAVRCRHRAGPAARPSWRRWSGPTCSWSRSTTAAAGTATTTSSPTCCRRTCWTSSPTTFPTCTAGRATGTSRTASRPRRSATRWPREDFERAADLVELAIPETAPEPAGGHAAPLAGGAARRGGPDQAGAQRRLCRVAPGRGARSRASRRGCGTPSGGWTRRRSGGDGGRGRGAVPRASRRRSRCTAPARPGPRRCGRHHGPRPARAGPASARTTMSRAGRQPPCWDSPSGRAGTSRPRTGWYADAAASLEQAGYLSDVLGLRDRAGRHPDRPGPSPRGDAQLRAGTAAGDRARPARRCGEPRTCTSA